MIKNNQYYTTLVRTWESELETTEQFLETFTADTRLNVITRTNLIKYYKNRIKRCKYNITRAKNLQKKI